MKYEKLLEKWPPILREEWPTGTFGDSRPPAADGSRTRRRTKAPRDPLAAQHYAALAEALAGFTFDESVPHAENDEPCRAA